MNRFWVVLAVVVLGLFGIFIFTGKDKNNQTAFTGDASKVQSSDHVVKAPNEKVVLIEYGDFQCPGCYSYYPIVKNLKETYKDQMTFVFRNLPLRQIHSNAQAAALAAEAAAKQGKFWEMHDKLYDTQPSWRDVITSQQTLFECYAEELGLNMQQFKADYKSAAVADKVSRDESSATAFKANSTPTFVLDGKKIDNPGDQTNFDKLIRDAIKKAGGTVAG